MIKQSTNSLLKLADFSANHYSQNGEDGIIEKIFGLIGVTNKICVEFGAWDGFHLSNTANLWTQGWEGVLIEGNRTRFRSLVNNVQQYNCVCVNAYVSPSGPTQLEKLLAINRIRETVIDLLCIDIDGDDYYILESLKQLRPRVVICEYNPTIPADVDLYAPYGSNFGASVAALTRLAESKGYKLVALTRTNCFFVLAGDSAKLGDYACSISDLRLDDSLVYLMTSYSGEYVASRPGPYGHTFPYQGSLIGTHQRFRSSFTPRRVAYNSVHIVKTIFKRLIYGR